MRTKMLSVLLAAFVSIGVVSAQQIQKPAQLQKLNSNLQKAKVKPIAPQSKKVITPLQLPSLPKTDEQCLAAQLHSRLLNNSADYARTIALNESAIQTIIQNQQQQKAAATTLTIPCVVHVMHVGEAIGTGSNISDAQIQSAIDNINDAFAANSDAFTTYTGVNTDIEFCLAQRDPSNNPSTGINRVDASGTSDFGTNGITTSGSNNESTIKALSNWSNSDYYNIWVVYKIDGSNGAGTQGYAYFPGAPNGTDGAVMLYNAFGYDPDGSQGYELKGYTARNVTFIHEVGHGLNLYHTFEGDNSGCPTGNGCGNGQGDCCADTPPHQASQSDCNTGGTNSCDGGSSNTLFVHNFMDYSSDVCQTEFTQDQTDRMRAALQGTRSSLLSSSGCDPVYTLDAGTNSVIYPSGSYCGTDVDPEIVIQNYGSTTLTSATITYNIDGGGNQTFNWTGSLTNGSTENVTLPTMTSTAGGHTFNVTVTNPNGGTDQNTSNDDNSGAFTIVTGNPVTVSITTDQWASESSWEIVNSGGTVEVSGPGVQFSDEAAAGEYPQPDTTVCLADGCYDFVMIDGYGDGMSGSYGNGEYSATDPSGNVLASGGAFSSASPGTTPAYDSTNFCVPYTVTPPVADFIANATNVPVGASVLFTDLSTGTPEPTSWDWDFAGGAPGTSTVENPIVGYNTVGTYGVTLTADNGSGTDDEIKANYINVFEASGGACDTLTNILAGETPTAYNFGQAWGVFPGHTDLMYEQYADVYTAPSATAVQKIVLPIIQLDAGNAASNVTFKVWASEGGVPGTVLASENRLFSQLNNLAFNTIEFTNPPMVSGNFFAGFELNYGTGDTLATRCAPVRASGANTTYLYVNGGWVPANAVFQGNPGTSLDMQVYLSDGMVEPNFTTSSTVICSGDSIQFDATSSYNGMDYYWDLDGNGTWDALGDVLWVPYSGGGTLNPELFALGGCGIDSMTTTITINNVIIASTVTDVSCAGNSDGVINTTASGTGGNHTWQWDANAGSSTAQDLTSLDEGVYVVTVSDDNGCSEVASITVDSSPAVTVTTSATDATSAGASDGTATAVGTGGNSTFTYVWDNGGNTATINGLATGQYCVTVTDGNGCSDSECIDVSEPGAPLSASAQVDNNEACGQGNGQATANGVGGTAPYTYAWDNGQNTATVTGLVAGIYTVTVSDATPSSATASVTITNDTGSLTANVNSTDETCGDGAGTATATAGGGSGTFTYDWSNNATDAALTGLSSGTYTVTIGDGSGCTIAESVTVSNNPGTLSGLISSNDEDCSNGMGDATVNPTGGTAPYTFTWDNTGSSQTISALSAGDYGVTVMDAVGCEFSISTTVGNDPGAFNANMTCNNTSGFGMGDGSASVVGNAGQTPYTYAWSPAPAAGQTDDNVTGLTGGTYYVSVTDANGCVASDNCSVSEPSCAVTITSVTTDESCQANGTAQVGASGGIFPYTYQWDVNAGSQATGTATGLSSGTYGVTITDDVGCVEIETVTVSNSAPTVAITATSDCGSGNGTATASMSGSTGPYSFSWDAAAGNQSTTTANNLAAGTYTVDVTDGSGCTINGGVTITSVSGPSGVTITTSFDGCNGQNAGSATASAIGGTAPYTYLWTDGQATATATGLAAGFHIVTVTDGNGCEALNTANISQPAAVTNFTSTTDENCGLGDGTASITLSGGTTPYFYYWGAISGNQTSPTATGLSGGTYNVTAVDNNGCGSVETVTVTNVTNMTAIVNTNDVDCYGDCDGQATVVGNGGVNPYTFVWSDNQGQQTATASNLCAGNYNVTVSDNTGCTLVEQVVINGPAPLLVTTQTSNENCSSGDGSASVSVSGGTAQYNYSWSNGANTSSVNNLTAGSYVVVVSDANSCTDSVNINISDVGGFTTTITPNSTICQGESVALQVVGGSSWNWSTGATSQNVVATTGGTYTCVVSNSAGCQQTLSTVVTVNNIPTVSIAANNTTVCPGDPVTLTASGASSYLWSPTGSSNASITVNPTTSQNIYSVIGYNGNCSSNPETIQLQFHNPLPVAVAGASSLNVGVGQNVDFSAAGSVGDSFTWDFDGNGVNDASGVDVSHSYPASNIFTVVLTSSLNGALCSSTDTLYINVGNVSGIEDEQGLEQTLNLFPNPTKGLLNVAFDLMQTDDVEIKIYNAIGELVENQQLNNVVSVNHKFDIMNESAGIYFVSITTSDIRLTRKVTLVK